jgi:lysozyme
MENPTKIGKLGLELIKHFEGLYLEAYKCPANVWTIGWGHTGLTFGKPIVAGMKITKEEAIELLEIDMLKYSKPVRDFVKVPLKQHQFDALVSFTYNCGIGALKTSTLLKLLNNGDYESVPEQLNRWNKGGGKILDGLVRRRLAEGHLWTTGTNKFHF